MVTEQINYNSFSNRNIITDLNILTELRKIHCKEEDFISKIREVFSKQTPVKLWFRWNYDFKIPNPYNIFPKESLLYEDKPYLDVPYNFSVTPITEPIRYYYRLEVLVQDGYVTVLEVWQEEA